MKSTLVFVYNADSGLFNALTDIAHKVVSPQTYSCNLCALTHSNFGMRSEWKRFIESLNRQVEFLHADELRARYGIKDSSLPAVFEKKGEKLETLVHTNSINTCQNIDDLQQRIMGKLSQPGDFLESDANNAFGDYTDIQRSPLDQPNA